MFYVAGNFSVWLYQTWFCAILIGSSTIDTTSNSPAALLNLATGISTVVLLGPYC